MFYILFDKNVWFALWLQDLLKKFQNKKYLMVGL